MRDQYSPRVTGRVPACLWCAKAPPPCAEAVPVSFAQTPPPHASPTRCAAQVAHARPSSSFDTGSHGPPSQPPTAPVRCSRLAATSTFVRRRRSRPSSRNKTGNCESQWCAELLVITLRFTALATASTTMLNLAIGAATSFHMHIIRSARLLAAHTLPALLCTAALL